MPLATPVTMPVAAFTVAIVVLLLLQTPPAESSEKVVVAPVQMLIEPAGLIASGPGFTVIVATAAHPLTV